MSRYGELCDAWWEARRRFSRDLVDCAEVVQKTVEALIEHLEVRGRGGVFFLDDPEEPMKLSPDGTSWEATIGLNLERESARLRCRILLDLKTVDHGIKVSLSGGSAIGYTATVSPGGDVGPVVAFVDEVLRQCVLIGNPVERETFGRSFGIVAEED